MRAIARDDNLTMSVVSNRINLGVNTTNIATTSSLTSGLSSKQDTLAFNIPSGGISLYATGGIVKGLKAAAPIIMTEAGNAITVGLAANTYEPAFGVVAPLTKELNVISGINDIAIDPNVLNPFWVAGRV